MLIPRTIAEFRKLLASLIELVYPSACAICGRLPAFSENPLCQSCMASMSPFMEDGPPSRLFLGYHEGPLRASIKLMKLGHRIAPAAFLGRFLGKLLRRVYGQVDGLIAVPSSHRRGRDFVSPAKIVAQEVAKSSKIQLLSEDFLVKTRYTKKQAFLSMEERSKNMSKAFKASPELKNKNIIIIDDVMTTGATMEACIQAIEEVGGKIFGTAFLSRRPLFVNSLLGARSKPYSVEPTESCG